MRAKLIYTLRALAMMAIMFVTSCSKGGEETTTKPPTKEQTYTITFNAYEGEVVRPLFFDRLVRG